MALYDFARCSAVHKSPVFMRLFSLFPVAGAFPEKSLAKNLPKIRASRFRRKENAPSSFLSPAPKTAMQSLLAALVRV